MKGSIRTSRARAWMLAAFLAGGALTLGSLARGASDKPDSDFGVILSEMRNAVAQAADLRASADRGGDRIRETCAYERLRGMMQAVDSTQIAQVAWEGDRARGDETAAAAEVTRAQQALELVRRMRNEADQCVGRGTLSRVASNTATTVTVESNVPDDDPNAGPVESWAVRPPRLELSGRPLPASPF